MNATVRTKLSVMMFLEFFAWGAWWVSLGIYLKAIGFNGVEIGSAYSTQGWAAIIAPIFVGIIADRFFPAQKVLAILHLLGAGLLFYASTVTTSGVFFAVALGYMICYMPTIALTNAISFHQMQDPGKEFPSIRVFGTIGWIVAGLLIGILVVNSETGSIATKFSTQAAEAKDLWASAQGTSIPMKVAALASLLLGILSFALPHTPPTSVGKKVTIGNVLGLDSLRLMKDFPFAIFAISSFLICIPLSFYYGFTSMFLTETGMENAVGKMTMGQGSEIFFMLVMPLFFKRLGVKKMLLVGMLFWVGRYVLFAYGNNQSMVWMYYAGILFHGICYDFFFVTGQIYVDKKAPEEIRASAQGFIAFITLGLGTVIGTLFSGYIVKRYGFEWVVDGVAQMKDGKPIMHHVWKNIWLTPAIMALVVAVIFSLFFKENGKDTPADDSAAGGKS